MLEAMVILQADKSLIDGSDELLKMEHKGSIADTCKARKWLEELPTTFDGVELPLRWNWLIVMTPTKLIGNLAAPTTKHWFRSQRALAEYIEVNRRPDISATVNLIALRSTEVGDAQFKALEKT